MDMKQHDTLPILDITLTDKNPDGTSKIVDLTLAISIRVIGKQNDAILFDRAPDTHTSTGQVTMAWKAGDTAIASDIRIEVEVTWAPGKIQTFPAYGTLVVRVRSDLG